MFKPIPTFNMNVENFLFSTRHLNSVRKAQTLFIYVLRIWKQAITHFLTCDELTSLLEPKSEKEGDQNEKVWRDVGFRDPNENLGNNIKDHDEKETFGNWLKVGSSKLCCPIENVLIQYWKTRFYMLDNDNSRIFSLMNCFRDSN